MTYMYEAVAGLNFDLLDKTEHGRYVREMKDKLDPNGPIRYSIGDRVDVIRSGVGHLNLALDELKKMKEDLEQEEFY